MAATKSNTGFVGSLNRSRRTRMKNRRLRFEALESRRVLASVISEVHVAPLFGVGSNDTGQFIELRGSPNTTLPNGTHFVVIEGWGAVPGGTGYIHSSINLSGLSFGSNGFLVIAQSGNPYLIDPLSTHVVSNGPGFSGLPDSRWSDASTLSDRLAFIFNSATFMLIESPQPPVPASDVDSNDDGALDGAAANWNIIDSVGLLNSTAGPSRSYGKITFSEQTNSLFPAGTQLIPTDGGGYVGRIGASIGWEPEDWVSGTMIDGDDSSAIQYRFTFGTFGDPRPLVYSGRQLDHVGTFNFGGGVVGIAGKDTNGDGQVDSTEPRLANTRIFADADQDGSRNNQSVQFSAGNVPDRTELTNRFPNATLTVANANNENIGFAVRTRSTFDNAFNTISVLASEGIPWFDSSDRLKIIFYEEANSIALDSIAASTLSVSYGRMEAYDQNNQLLQVYQTSPLLGLQRETMRILRPTADIKYVIVYTNDSIPNSSPFGKFDRLVYTFPEFEATTDALGRYSIDELPPGDYEIRVSNGAPGQIPAPNSVRSYDLLVTKSEHLYDANFAFRDNSPPIVTTTQFSLAENPIEGTVVGQVIASDPDAGHSIQFEFVGASGPFGIDATTGVITVNNQQPWDFETISRLVIELKVTDSFTPPLSTNVNLTITPIDVNEPPIVSNGNFTLSEKATTGSLVGTINATDVDAGLNGTLRYFLGSNVAANRFAVDPLSGEISLLSGANLDFALEPVLSIPVLVRDQGNPPLSATGSVQVQLIDVNDPPRFVEYTQVVGVLESTASGTATQVATLRVVDDSLGTNTVSLGGLDAALFSIVGNKLVFTNRAPLDFETRQTYSVVINVDDPTLGTTPDVASTFTLQIVDVNEAPTAIQLSNLAIVPESSSGTGPRVANILVSDDALGTNQISLSGADGAKFQVVGQELRFRSGVVLDFESQSEFRFTLSVDDLTVGTSPDASASFTFTIADVNEAPTIAIDVLSSIVDESSLPTDGFPVANLELRDDALGTNAFVLSGLDASSFEVVGMQLRVKQGVVFDYDQKTGLDVTVAVVDASLPNAAVSSVEYRLTIRDLAEVVSITDKLGAPLTTAVDNIRLVWDSVVTVDPLAIRLVKTDVGPLLVATSFVTSTVGGRTVADLSFSGPLTNSGRLREGEYTVFVDGLRVKKVGTPFNGASFRSNSIDATDPALAGNLDLTAPAFVLSSQEFNIDMLVRDLATPITGNVDYKVDIHGDGTIERTASGPLSLRLSHQFADAGSYTIVVIAEKSGVKIAQNSIVVDVSPATTSQENWLLALDADRDNTVSPLDVLSVVNQLNSRIGNNPVPYRLSQDVDRDGTISPLDVLALVNYLNADASSALRAPVFSELVMASSGTVPGFTNTVVLSGKIAGSSRSLFVSLDDSPKKDASSFVHSDGTFAINDAAIAQLFGSLTDGSHTLSVMTKTGDAFSTASDRRFYRSTNLLSDFQITSAVETNGQTRLRWSSSASGARYRVYASTLGNVAAPVTGLVAATEAKFTLPAGQYQLFVEAVDAAGNTVRSGTISHRVD